MKNWFKLAALSLVCALSLTACTSSDPADAPDPEAAARALSVELPVSQCVDREVRPDGTVVERCCLEGTALCVSTQQEFNYVCNTRPHAIAACQAACGGVPCVRTESNSCLP